ncbi:MAG: hypothetical protein GY855_05705 [candidate division Zixibacteria bacterium]|nr:hypothetical protein [candidate division Zixibacteria bacterium]
MNEFMSGIKAVPGVRGVMIVDKAAGRIHRMFPARYEKEDLKILAASLRKLSRAGLSEGLLAVYFSSGTVISFMNDNLAVLALARSDVDNKMLKDRMKKLLPSIIRKTSKSETLSVGESASHQIPMNHDLMLEAINQLSQKIRQNLGGYIAARELKRARDTLISQYDFLTGLYVDNSGNCAAITKPLVSDEAIMIKAFGELISSFYAACLQVSPKVQAFPLREILRKYSLKLSEIGFWE